MEREDMKKLLARIDATYPNWKPKDLSLLVDVWLEEFAEYSYNDVLIAVKTYIRSDRSGFAPSIGQLIGILNDLKEEATGEYLSDAEAWAMVSNAIGDSIYHAREHFDELPPLVQKAVGSPETLRSWGTDNQYNENVVQSLFVRSYHTECERKKKFNAYPVEVQNLITASTQKLLGGGQK